MQGFPAASSRAGLRHARIFHKTSLLVLRLNHADAQTVLERILLLGVSDKSSTKRKTISEAAF